VRQKLATIELAKAARGLLPEPHIVIEIVLHELLHIFVGAALNVGGDLVDLVLQFRREVHFHELRVGKVVSAVKPGGLEKLARADQQTIYWLRNEDSNI
jgi:hypothetical protein